MLGAVLMVISLFPASQEMNELRAVELAKTTLRELLDAGESAEIELRQVSAMDWPDGSLGCPQKGLVYTQAIVPGFLVMLNFQGGVYSIHVGNGRAVVCPEPSGGVKRGRAEDAAASARMFLEARKDLARRLEVEERDIETRFIRPETWSDASLGCPEEGESYAQVETPGYRIELAYDAVTYEYHTDQEKRYVFCGDLAGPGRSGKLHPK